MPPAVRLLLSHKCGEYRLWRTYNIDGATCGSPHKTTACSACIAQVLSCVAVVTEVSGVAVSTTAINTPVVTTETLNRRSNGRFQFTLASMVSYAYVVLYAEGFWMVICTGAPLDGYVHTFAISKWRCNQSGYDSRSSPLTHNAGDSSSKNCK